jgi:hypothetical protein
VQNAVPFGWWLKLSFLQWLFTSMASAAAEDRKALAQFLQETHEKVSAEGFCFQQKVSAEQLNLTIMPSVTTKILCLLQREPGEVCAKFMWALEEAEVLPSFQADIDGLRTAIGKCIQILDDDAQDSPCLSCCICFESKPAHEGIKCSCDDLVCRECLDQLARAFVGKDLALLERDDGRLKCPGLRCSAAPYYYPNADMAIKITADVFDLLIKARLQVQERKIRLEMQQMQQTQAPMQTDADKARKHIEELLTLKCPRCAQAYVDFNGCAALACSGCGGAFCAWCGVDAGDDAHDHVAQCKAKPPRAGTHFGTEEEFKVAQKRHKRRLVNEYLCSHPAAVQQQLREEMKTQFAACGVDAEEDAWPEADVNDQDVDVQELWVNKPGMGLDDEDFEQFLAMIAVEQVQQAPIDEGVFNLVPLHAGQQAGAQAPPPAQVHADEQRRKRHRREGRQGQPHHQQGAWAEWNPPGDGPWADWAPPGNREEQPNHDPWRRERPAAQAAPANQAGWHNEQISKEMTSCLRHGNHGFLKKIDVATGYARLSDLVEKLKFKYTEEHMIRVVWESFNSRGARFELSGHAGHRMIRSTERSIHLSG